MAVIKALTVDTQNKGIVFSWLAVAQGDTGEPIQVMEFGELTHGSVGTFTTVTWQASMDGGTTWAAVGAGHTDTVPGAATRMAEHPYLVRPVFTTIGGTTTAYLACSRAFY